MGHALEPRSGVLPPLDTIVELLKREFAYVRVDREGAMARLRRHIQRLEQTDPSMFLGRHADVLAHLDQLKKTTLEQVLCVEFGDDEKTARDFVLWPGDSIKFGYRGDEDERDARPVLERCAAALDCDLLPF
jgi:hypothetical protein